MPSNLVEVLKVSSATRQTFTVNSAVNEVAIAIGGTNLLEDVFGFNYFKRMDSPLLLEAGIMLPYGFGLSTEPLYVALDWLGDDGIAEFSAASFTIPAGPCSISFPAEPLPAFSFRIPALGRGQ